MPLVEGNGLAGTADRKRTVQACDKCRERKTKCTGAPVCGRCTTRGLICQFTSREPRTRGPAKARLRNAVSVSDLRGTSFSSQKYFSPATGGAPFVKSERSVPQLQQPHPPHGYGNNTVRSGPYPGLRRVASIPATQFTSHPPPPIRRDSSARTPTTPTTAGSYESWRDVCGAPSPFSPFSPFPFDEPVCPISQIQMPSVHFGSHATAATTASSPSHLHWRDVPHRVQDPSTFTGCDVPDLKAHFDYGLHSSLPFSAGNNSAADFLGAPPPYSAHAPPTLTHDLPDFIGTTPSFDMMIQPLQTGQEILPWG